MPTYSHSRLSTFEQCPIKFKFRYIEQVETEIENSIEAFMGSRVHETLEKLYKDLKFMKLNTLPELISFYNEQWEKNWNDNILIVRTEYTPENYKIMGEKFISEYYAHYHPFNHARTVGLEMQINVKIGNYILTGVIDRLSAIPDGVYEIHDYKTSNSLPTQEEIDADRQLALYSIAVKEMFSDCKEIRLIWHYLAFDKELISERTDTQLESLKQEIIKVIEKVESTKDFPSKKSELCYWCEFQKLCPEWKHKFQLEEKDENEYKNDSGLKLVNEYAILKQQEEEISLKLEKIKEALVEFTKKERVNNVYGSEHIAFVKEYPRLSFPKKEDFHRKEFEDTIKKLGLWDRLAIVDVYELAKMINNSELHEDFLKILDKFTVKGATTYVRLRDRF